MNELSKVTLRISRAETQAETACLWDLGSLAPPSLTHTTLYNRHIRLLFGRGLLALKSLLREVVWGGGGVGRRLIRVPLQSQLNRRP